MCSGIIIWALHFAAIYGFTALACAFGLGAAKWPWFSVPAVVVILTAVALAAVLAFVVPAVRAGLSAFENAMTAGLGALAALAIVWEGLIPVIMLPPCV